MAGSVETWQAIEVITDLSNEVRPRYRVGSGLLMVDRLVLTAAHNIAGAPATVSVRVPGRGHYAVRPLAVGGPDHATDLAVLEVSDLEYEDRVFPVPFFAVDRDVLGTIEQCIAIGYPSFKDQLQDTNPRTVAKESVQIRGEIHVGSGLKSGLLELLVGHQPRLDTNPGVSPWQGMSGAAVLVRDAEAYGVIGIIVAHAPREGGSSLTVVPITNLNRALGDGAREIWRRWRADPATLIKLPRSGRSRTSTPNRIHAVNLDRAPSDFSGRRAEVDQIRDLLTASESPVVVLHGMGGVGKTTLATYVAHVLGDWFDHARVTIKLALDAVDDDATAEHQYQLVFDAFDFARERRPIAIESQQNLYRDLLGGGRSLVIVDNASSVGQVERFLPNRAGCATLVTSRYTLTELTGAQHLRLDPFPVPDALAFLAETMGVSRLLSEPEAGRRIAALTGALPLALHIVSAFANRPVAKHRPLSAIAGMLEDEQVRLAHLDGKEKGVRASLHLSYRQLSADSARFVRRLGLLTGPDFGADLAAAIAGVSTPAAAAALDDITDSHLLETTSEGRYRMHDLVRLYARERATKEETADELAAATARWFRWYVEALDRWQPKIAHDGEVPSPRALCWFIAEEGALQAALGAAYEAGDAATSLRLAEGLRPCLWYRGRYVEFAQAAERGLRAAHRDGLEHKAIGLMVHLAETRRVLGDTAGVDELYDRAERLAVAAGDVDKETWVRVHRGNFALEEGRAADALAAFRSVQRVYDERGDIGARIWLAGQYISAYQALDQYDEAIRHGEQALRWSLDRDISGEIAWSSGHLGLLYLRVGRLAEAEKLLTRALEVVTNEGDPVGQAHRLRQLGWVAAAAGDHRTARDRFTRALAVAEELGITDLATQISKELRDLPRHGEALT